MKFHCDRCKTRYSIADERVRGKILKIRCKNCSAVITVRENMGAAPAPAPVRPGGPRKATTADGPMAKTLAGTGAAGAGAPGVPARRLTGAGAPAADKSGRASLAAAVRPAPAPQPQPPPVPPAPDTLDEEWYVSLDGNQFGPFSLHEAQDWVAAREPTDDLHCWSEDFDDWLPVEKVSHFRGLREEKLAAMGIGSAPLPEPRSDTEKAAPVAPSADDLATEENQRAPSHAEPDMPDMPDMFDQAAAGFDKPPVGPNRAGEPPTLGEDDGLDLDIGEASRIVKLPHLMRMSGVGGGAQPGAGVDADGETEEQPAPASVARIGKGSGSVARLPADAPALAPLSDSAMASASPDILHAPPSSLKRQWLIIAVLAALIPGLVIFFVITRDGGGEEDETGVRRSGYQGLGAGGSGGGDTRRLGIETNDGDDNGKTTRRRNPNPGRRNGKTSKKSTPDAAVDSGDPSARPLGPADITRAARRGGAANRRCYMRAQRKDFNIARIKRIRFYIKVDPSGTVTQVTPKEHTDTYLARCVRNAIRRWKFRKSPKGIATETSIVFAQ